MVSWGVLLQETCGVEWFGKMEEDVGCKAGGLE